MPKVHIMLLLKHEGASAFTRDNTIMLEPSVSHLTLDLFLDATAEEMWGTAPSTLIANSGLNVCYPYMLLGQDFPLGPGFWNKLISYDAKFVRFGVCLPACGNKRRKEGVLCEVAGPYVRLDAGSMSSLDIYAVNTITWFVQESATGILEKPQQTSSK